ncbi:hypothetical protein [Luteitalea pratensis]|uniref:hypothetical protein n=1 Tax=Luteitalea pratensis TaxID=1855912 RepID=UPI000D73A4B9|nr:hypothetical protein [Luteitalea pratensis]
MWSVNDFLGAPGDRAIVTLHPRYMHVEPIGVAMAGAWGSRMIRDGYKIEVENIERGMYLDRMKLFEVLGIESPFAIRTHEEAGRFIPLRNVKTNDDIRAAVADISALLHLDGRRDVLHAVQYCLSELLRNVIEHSSSPDGAFVCPLLRRRGAIADLDCGCGLRDRNPESLGSRVPGAPRQRRSRRV